MSIKTALAKSMIGIGLMLGVNSAFAATGSICKNTDSIYQTISVSQQDKVLTLNKAKDRFSFNWQSRGDSYKDFYWTLNFNVNDPSNVRMLLREVRFDDNLKLTLNGTVIYTRNGGGLSTLAINKEVSNALVKGMNTLQVHLRNNQSEADVYALFSVDEVTCETNDLPRPNIPQLPDSEKCVESLICTEGREVRSIGGALVERDCWNWETKRTCMDFSQNPELCIPPTVPSNTTCEMVSMSCAEEGEYIINGKTFNACMRYEKKMQCTSEVSVSQLNAQERAEYEAENERRRMLCKPVQTCVGNDCYVTSDDRDKADGDMPYVLALLELGRQAGTYMDPNNIKIFSGVESSCRSMRGFGAMAHCCDIKSPVAKDSSGQSVTPTNANTFNNVYQNVETTFNNPTTSANKDYVQVGSNPYTYDALYKPNEAAYMLQGTEAMLDTEAGKMGLNSGGASTITVMGYGWSNSGTATGDQQSFNDYSSRPNTGTPND